MTLLEGIAEQELKGRRVKSEQTKGHKCWVERCMLNVLSSISEEKVEGCGTTEMIY